MDIEYDRKFEEMKQYIPFLESMIKRFTNTNATENPCQAQLDKIKSLRDLLVDKKKRMKMANLLKCEQVLINLYAKVEKRDNLPGIVGKKASEVIVDDQQKPSKPELEKVRNKLMTVVGNLNTDPDTLPEIARATESDSTCTPGSKEPALFQRRPNRSPTKSEKQRNYTRVLVSPETDETQWISANTPRRDMPLFVRRSPRRSPHRSPRRRSSSYHKKEKKKPHKRETESLMFNKFNITLKVPKESLHSLNSKDILSRIINCSDTDVDIASLRQLRYQILGELKQTGANEDISDLILKSYEKGKQRQKTKEEIEEGELSDSESEAIDSIYSSLVVVENDRALESSSDQLSSVEKDKESRKIQICLVINSDDNKNTNSEIKKTINSSSVPEDVADFEMYDKKALDKTAAISQPKNNIIQPLSEKKLDKEQLATGQQSEYTIDSDEKVGAILDDKVEIISTVKHKESESIDKEDELKNEAVFKPNFYNPLSEKEPDYNKKKINNCLENSIDETKPFVSKSIEEAVSAICKTTSENVQIPLLNTDKNIDETPTIHETLPKQEIVSEIDILRALKNEILSDNIIPLSVTGNDNVAPLLHQPKITKVVNAQEIKPKKRISIESYKEKVVSAKTITPLFMRESEVLQYTDDSNKKQSLKLTEKECERFNFPAKLALDYSSDEDYKDKTVDDIYEDLVPKSPDNDASFNLLGASSPVIIPVDPVKTLTVSSKSDVDMRTLPPRLSPNIPSLLELTLEVPKLDSKQEKNGNVRPLTDPRLCRDLKHTENYSPNQSNPDKTPMRSNTSSVLPNMAISMTPNSRALEKTPSYQSIDIEGKKHVYAPLLSNYEYQDQRENISVKESKQNKYDQSDSRQEHLNYRLEEVNKDNKYQRNKWNDRDGSRSHDQNNTRENSSKDRDFFDVHSKRLDGPRFGRSDCPSTPSHPFGRSDCPPTPSHSFGRSECPLTPNHPFGRSDCPPTPSHPFGSSECPSTPSHSFGRSDCPPTPSHPFGRSECPSTPVHPFGRSDCPPTPSHQFARLDCPTTPVHPFGRHEVLVAKSYGMVECPTTPIHPFGNSDFPTTPVHSFGRSELLGRNDYSQNQSIPRFGKDPRLNRSNEYDSNTRRYDKDNRYDRNRSSTNYRETNWEVNSGDSYKNESRNYRNSRDKGFEASNRFYSKEAFQMRDNRRESQETSISRNTSDGRFVEHNSRYRNTNAKGLNSSKGSRDHQRSETHHHYLPTARSSSVGRKYDEKPTSNTFSVKPHAGRSFTIDTSINSTFQELINKSGNFLVDNAFNARRERAVSVGRSCLHEASLSRTTHNKSSYHDERNSNKNDHFRRAASVGRDLPKLQFKESLTDVKARFKATYDHAKKQKEGLEARREINPSRSRSDIYQKDRKRNEYDSINKYSPKRNIRDPRNRRDHYRTKEEERQKNKYDKRSSGIVYSNDNIAKGTVLGAASGVKNYKIPKIKRPVEEPEIALPKVPESSKKTQIDTENSNGKSSKIDQETLSSIQINKNSDNSYRNEIDEHQKLNDKGELKQEKSGTSKVNIQSNPQKDLKLHENLVLEKRLTRSIKNKNEDSHENYVLKPYKKGKKAVKLDSDSDEDKLCSKNENNIDIAVNNPINSRDNLEPLSTMSLSDRESNSKMSLTNVTDATDASLKETIDNTFIKKIGDSLESCFNFDDLDVFSDNLGTEPVIDNINALIADLDNDIDAPKDDKNDSFSKEICMENMLNNITDTEHNILRESPENDTLNVIDEFIKENLSKTDDKIYPNETKVTAAIVSEICETGKKINHDKIDSSCSIVNKDIEQSNDKENINILVEHTDLPDSTINSDNIEDSGLMKSSPLEDNETSAITSTIDNLKEPSSSQKEQTVDQLDSLLSLFKDKSKLKELLSMLDDKSNENEKIKKKLEKLSAIVSDDEDDLGPHYMTSMSKERDHSLNKTSTSIKQDQIASYNKKDYSLKDAENISKNNVEETISNSNNACCNQIDNNLELSKKQENTSDDTNLIGPKNNEVTINDGIDKVGARTSESKSDKKSEDLILPIKVSDIKETNEVKADEPDTIIKLNKDKNLKKAETNLLAPKTGDHGKYISENNDFQSEDSILSIRLSDEGNADGYDGELNKENNFKKTETNLYTPESIDNRQKIGENNDFEANELKKGELITETNNFTENPDVLDSKKDTESKIVKSNTFLNSENNTDVEINLKELNKGVESEDLIQKPEKQNENETNLIKSVDTDKPDQEKKITRKNTKKSSKGKKTNKQKVTMKTKATIEKPKKINRELLSLQNDIKEMFISEAVLNNTGIRMCRLVKLTEEKAQKDVPTVVDDESIKTHKKPGPKPKLKQVMNKSSDSEKSSVKSNLLPKSKPGPKSKTKFAQNSSNSDPYLYEIDSNNEFNSVKEDKCISNLSDSDSDTSSVKSHESTEVLIELKKKKRKHGGWKSGIIKTKKKKKIQSKRDSFESVTDNTNKVEVLQKTLPLVPDMNCFTDKSYCFVKNVFNYSCRLCNYSGNEIVHHYKKQHPHTEIPLSRMTSDIANEAIEQCEDSNFAAISKLPTEKYTCRFCFKEFSKRKAVLESFFWHIVSTHTGEYKQQCSECVNVEECPFNLDIPPPPKNVKGQLIGYICAKCNYTQISLENLKTHVIDRHNDEQTEVYTINLSSMSKNTINMLLKRLTESKPRVLRSSRANVTMTEMSDDCSDVSENSEETNETEFDPQTSCLKKSIESSHTKTKSNIKSKITFENDDNISENSLPADTDIKVEQDADDKEEQEPQQLQTNESKESRCDIELDQSQVHPTISPIASDVVKTPHFKVSFTKSGTREYVCCVDQKCFYKTSMTISMKKHLQIGHKEKWDGFCYLCEVIVTSQGKHSFKDCFQHFLDKHIDDFEVIESEPKINEEIVTQQPINLHDVEAQESPTKPYISVRPISDLIATKTVEPEIPLPSNIILPQIQNVVSLGASVDQGQSSPIYPAVTDKKESPKQYKYEEWQADIMLKKHRVVLDTMMARAKLCHVFKCTGRYCSFSTDSAEDALLHASTHQRVGGEGALNCAYCDFDTSGNVIDLVMHVFKNHGGCQYVCGHCFYRAVAAQLVNAHSLKAHPDTTVLILHSTVVVKPPNNDDNNNALVRTDAVPHFVCGNIVDNALCKFRTYTSTKFYEHLQQRHEGETSYKCSKCQNTFSVATELVYHMKTHGLKLYQCTWCVYGEDIEEQFLSHASSKHPDKQPQAYLRIITGKDGSLRVLPLAYLNKSSVPSEDVTPGINNENPVKEAERSTELEKLIGHTIMLIEQSTSQTFPVDNDNNFASVNTTSIEQPTDVVPELILQQTEQLPEQTPSRPETPSNSTLKSFLSQQLTPILKTVSNASADKNRDSSNFIYSLDSDDDNTAQNIIDLSSDDQTSLEPAVVNVPPEPTTVIAPLEPTSVSAPPEPVVVSEPKIVSNEIAPTKPDESDINILPDETRKCNRCNVYFIDANILAEHVLSCFPYVKNLNSCPNCMQKGGAGTLMNHVKVCIAKRFPLFKMDSLKSYKSRRYICGVCQSFSNTLPDMRNHMKKIHNINKVVVESKSVNPDGSVQYTVYESNKTKQPAKRKMSTGASKQKRYGPQDIDQLPINPILDESVYCSLCEFNTKVRLNMVRHLQFHAEQQPVPQTAPVNPVPHLETNEMHFDRMINLASSSLVARYSGDKQRPESNAPVVQIPPEAASRYPKYVPDRQRHTCGAKGCSYISVDEAMLKHHWEALHTGSVDYRCVHCPAYQQLDKSMTLTSVRIIAHLKMHDSNLYGCSICSYYHYKRQIVEKHLKETHKGLGNIMIIREESPPSPVAAPVTAPTMDLRAWQCGLCDLKSMLRAEVAEHCSKVHQSKMQFKCTYCPFRTSTKENITKHQSTSHVDMAPDVFYYFYREGDVPDEPDGVPLWTKQRLIAPKNALDLKPEVDPTLLTLAPQVVNQQPPVNLNTVKIEVMDPDPGDCVDDLCNKFGQFCDPNGLKYKCPLCKVVFEDCRQTMQSHLYEELRYRKWACKICSYKAFHKKGLDEHLYSEHRVIAEPIELPVDVKIETWVCKLLEHQENLIKKSKDNLAKQKIQEIPKSTPTSKIEPTLQISGTPQSTSSELQIAFGNFGNAVNGLFCCPKCDFKTNEESLMQDHLETELTKIRWSCSICVDKFQSYHEAQFHCKSTHSGRAARPLEARRDPTLRAAWRTSLVQHQKLQLNLAANEPKTLIPESQQNTEQPSSDAPDADNSLLVVRYEERIPIPEGSVAKRKRPAPTPSLSDSDDDRLHIDDSSNDSYLNQQQVGSGHKCPYCVYTSRLRSNLSSHVLRHYGLKLYACGYCNSNSDWKKKLLLHHSEVHKGLAPFVIKNKVPNHPPVRHESVNPNEADNQFLVCLSCKKTFTDLDSTLHVCNKNTQRFSAIGNIIVKCGICFNLYADVKCLYEHHKLAHKEVTMKDYSFFKIQSVHNSGFNKNRRPNYEIVEYNQETNARSLLKRTSTDFVPSPSPKRVAKKSTSKLPILNTVAKKSTTKLPLYVYSDSEDDFDDHEQNSYYGTKPAPIEQYEHITTLMPIYNTIKSVNIPKLSKIMEINPRVVVRDIKNTKV